MRARLLLGALLLLAPPALAHFHEGLSVPSHALRFRLAAGTVLVEETFQVRNDGSGPFAGRVYAWLPPAATLERFGPPGSPPVSNGSALVDYNLTAHGLSLAPNATLDFELAWHQPLAPGEAVERRLVYPTGALQVVAEPPLAVLASPVAGAGDFASLVRVAHPAPPLLEGWQGLVLLSAGLLAAAWLWDRRRRGPAKP